MSKGYENNLEFANRRIEELQQRLDELLIADQTDVGRIQAVQFSLSQAQDEVARIKKETP